MSTRVENHRQSNHLSAADKVLIRFGYKGLACVHLLLIAAAATARDQISFTVLLMACAIYIPAK